MNGIILITTRQTIKDISNYLYGNEMPIIEKMGEYITNELQLLIVIPKTSKNLLNEKLQKIMEDKTLGLYHMFPLKYKIHTYLKTHLWECFPELPKINIELMKKILKNYLKFIYILNIKCITTKLVIIIVF